MRQISRLILCIVVLNISSAYGEEILYSWDFGTPGDSEGWRPTHDLSNFTVYTGVLKTTSTGSDPYMHGPDIFVDAAMYTHLKVRMKVSAGSAAELFWTLKGMPHELAGYEQPFTLIADNQFHEYLVYVGTHNKWQDTVIRLRLDPTDVPGANIEIDYIQVLSIGPRLEIKNFGTDVLLPKTDEFFNLGCVVAGTGDQDVKSICSQIFVPAGLVLQTTDTVEVWETLSPGEAHEFRWTVKAMRQGEYTAKVAVNAGNIAQPLEATVVFEVDTLFVELPPEIPDVVRAFQFNSNFWILENSRVRLAFDRLRNFRFYTAQAGEWYLVGACKPLSKLEYQLAGQPRQVELTPDSLAIIHSSADSARLVISGYYLDENGGTWDFQFQFVLTRQMRHFDISYQLKCSHPRELRMFTGPSIYVGEGSFGEQLKEAILPGLEWLVEGEHSSNTLDAQPPHNLRFAPHPLKITAPLAAVNYDGVTAGLFWEPLQKWDGVHAYPAIEFSAPNWLEGQRNHKITMMLPSIPDYIAENRASATNPYSLQAGQTLTLSGQLYALSHSKALDAFDYYFQLHGMPGLQPLARSLDAEVALCRDGFQSVWSEAKQGWQHAMHPNWLPEPHPGFAYLQYLDGILSDDPIVKDILNRRVSVVLNKILRTWHEAGLARRTGCHIVGWQFPFYVGHLAGALAEMKREPTVVMQSQQSSGGWPYSGKLELGEIGKCELGTCAQNTFILLYYYQISGEKPYLEAAVKALEFMQQFKVPRGAQTWEVPLHTPDILAAGHAVRAYVAAFRITNEPTYLEQARYWGRAGLPFVYLWNAPGIDTMPFATIPVLGATFYKHPWFGKPVQWCGLVYAHALFELAKVDPEEHLWHLLAEGITRSAMHMQYSTGSNKGTYPDSWDMLSNTPHPVDINPEDIIKNVLFLTGHNPELDHKIIETNSKPLHLTSAARIQGMQLDPINRTLDFDCEFHPQDTCYVLIAGLIKTPTKIIKNGAILNGVNDVDHVHEGWQYTNDGFLILKFIQPDRTPVSFRITDIKTNADESDKRGEALPTRFYLGQNYPNPFSVGNSTDSGVTAIEYQLPQASAVEIRIYDLRGRLVKTLLEASKSAGSYRLNWDGRNAQQVPVASGLYICRLTAEGRNLLRKVVVIK